jgi:hypothetical protein
VAILFTLILVVMIVVGVVVFLLSRGTVVLVAIPGFPPEAIFVGLVLGLLLLAFKRARRSSKSPSKQ